MANFIHILFLTTEEIKKVENGQIIERDIENEKIFIVKADNSKEASLIQKNILDNIDKENKQ